MMDDDLKIFQLPRAQGIPHSLLRVVDDPNIPGAMLLASGQIVVKKG